MIFSEPAGQYWIHAVELALATLLGGVVNSVAGGGGFLVFPTLIKIGVQPIQANATATVGLWPGQFTSIVGYREDLRRNHRLVIPAGSSALVGGVAGAWTLLHNSQQSFMRLVPYLFVMGAILFAVSGPVGRWVQRRIAEHKGEAEHVLMAPMVLGLLPVCFYIGYFGAGAGLITMTVLALCGVSRIAEMNALKVVVTTIANGVAVLTFMAHRVVEWRYCWLMMLTCGLGGYLGSRYGRKLSDKVLRPAIVAVGLLVAGYFFWKAA